MKKIIIYTTHDEVISLHLVNSIIADPQFKNYKIDIKLSYPSFLRKIKILFVIIFFGSIKIFLKSLQNKISLKNILDNNKLKNKKLKLPVYQHQILLILYI